MKQFGRGFDWQEGYGAFSVSASQLESVVKYIQNQGRYHKKVSFQQEYISAGIYRVAQEAWIGI